MIKKILLVTFLVLLSTTSSYASIQNQNSEIECLAEAIYYEGRNLSDVEKEMIADVVFNRKKSKMFPNNICRVVYEKTYNKKRKVYIHQFSWTKSKPQKLELETYEKILDMAKILYTKKINGNHRTTKALFFSKGPGVCSGKKICHNFR
jgi:hypothetical protein